MIEGGSHEGESHAHAIPLAHLKTIQANVVRVAPGALEDYAEDVPAGKQLKGQTAARQRVTTMTG